MSDSDTESIIKPTFEENVLKKLVDLKDKKNQEQAKEHQLEIKDKFTELFWEASWFISGHTLSYSDFVRNFSSDERILLEKKMRKCTSYYVRLFCFFGAIVFQPPVFFLILYSSGMSLMETNLTFAFGSSLFVGTLLVKKQSNHYPVVDYFLLRRKLVFFGCEAAVEEAIREMKAYTGGGTSSYRNTPRCLCVYSNDLY